MGGWDLVFDSRVICGISFWVDVLLVSGSLFSCSFFVVFFRGFFFCAFSDLFFFFFSCKYQYDVRGVRAVPEIGRRLAGSAATSDAPDQGARRGPRPMRSRGPGAEA